MSTRRILLALAAVAVLAVLAFVFVSRVRAPGAVSEAGQPTPAAYWPTEGWRTATPEEQGFDSVKLAEGLQALKDEHVPIDSLLIIRNGYVILDAYFQPYDGKFAHDLASVTKSFTTTLVGIAAGQGKLTLGQPVVSFFPDRTIANLDPRKQGLTVLHLASMSNGFESGCLRGDEPTLDAMRSQPDWIQAALDRKVTADPGLAFCYDSPGMHLLSGILREATGVSELEFARRFLFEPLGIRDVTWKTDPQGYTHGWGDLHLRPLDAAKLGYLWLQGGMWDGAQVVPASWVRDAVKPLHPASGDDYGYGWWVSEDSYYATGRGGQNIKVYPAYNAVVVTTASSLDYDQLNPLLRASLLSLDKPLPANPEGVAKLQTTLAALAQAPQPVISLTLPDTARIISGKTYVFGPEAQKVALLASRLEFNDTSEASVHLKFTYGDVTWRIGLAGKYLLGTDGQASRGYWADPQTFVIEAFDIGVTTYRFRFDDDRVLLTSPNIPGELEGVIGEE